MYCFPLFRYGAHHEIRLNIDILKQKIVKLKIDNVCQGNLRQVYIRTFLVNRLLGIVVYLVTL